ncbi:MAG: superoxide dismutase [Akkermansiaceae bacterium]
MQTNIPLDRRHFVKLGTLAASAAFLSGSARAQEAATTYSLPELPYEPDALEPHIDAQTMEIHHGKHHASYVNNLNEALETAPAQVPRELEKLLASLPDVADEALRTKLRNNGGGHWNHDFFWKTLSPADKTGQASNKLAEAINSTFDSMESFQKSFDQAATGRFGSGWAWLIVQNGKLKITSTPNQDNPLMRGLVADEDLGTPILGLDVWEHAYYLKYQNRRPEYVSAWWNVVNWSAVSERHAAAVPNQ